MNSGLNGDSNSDPCDAGALLHQMTHQANWELVVMGIDHSAKKLRRALTHSFQSSVLMREIRVFHH